MNKHARRGAYAAKHAVGELPEPGTGGLYNAFSAAKRTRSRISVADAVKIYQDYARTRGYSPQTIRSYSYLADVICRMSGLTVNVAVSNFTRQDAERCIRNLGKSYQPTTAWSYSSKIIHLFRIFAVAGLILENPFGCLARPRKPDARLGTVLTKDEIKKLMTAPDATTRLGISYRAVLEVLYSTAIRLSELRNLEVRDLDLSQGTLTVRGGKGGKDRVVPLGQEAAKWVKKYLIKVRAKRAAGSPALWINAKGKPLSRNWAGVNVRRMGLRVGVKVNPHTLRRSCATHLLEGGASPVVVQGILGHADLKTLGRYLKLTLRELKHVHQTTHPRG